MTDQEGVMEAQEDIRQDIKQADTDKTDAAMTDVDRADSGAPADFLPPLPEDEGLRILEALLFATADPLPTSAIRNRMPENADVGGLLLTLQAHYEDRGVNLVEIDGTWAFRTAPDLKDLLELEREETRKLSRAAMEIMAIIAYHQPVTRAEIENIRGVTTSKGTLDILIEAGWVKPGRRRQTPGRPVTWKTTTAFLDHFGLESMTDLPGLDELKAAGLLDRRPAIETVTMTGELFDEDEDHEDHKDEDREDESGEDATESDIDSDDKEAYEEEETIDESEED